MLTKTIDVREAQKRLLELIRAMTGESEITLMDDNKPIARLVPINPPIQTRVAGLHAGAIWTSDDFDEPLPDALWLGDA
jgi:antitoxin (DNA-binding transcriptional repressor) of toxin-antitoxin stability system